MWGETTRKESSGKTHLEKTGTPDTGGYSYPEALEESRRILREAVTVRPPDSSDARTGDSFFPSGKESKDMCSTKNVQHETHRKAHPDTPLRVAAYIRVSSGDEVQENSYEVQESYFTNLLHSHPGWVSAGIYSDFGISGTGSVKRTGFTRLLRHCREGRIDKIVCKSISRFARNTSDLLNAVGVLEESGVTIVFEKESIDTADPLNAFILTTLGAVAQEESRSISENIKWGIRRHFAAGESKNLPIYGYRFNGKMITTSSGYTYEDVEIVEEEAKIVRRIFKEVSEGERVADIAGRLNAEHVPAPQPARVRRSTEAGENKYLGERGWTKDKIDCILCMERYTGDVLRQKSFTIDYLTHRYVKNRGEMPQYLITDHHPAIISREIFESVQKRKALGDKADRPDYAFSGRLICAHCGRPLHMYNPGVYPKWICPAVRNSYGMDVCHAEKVYEAQVIRMLRKAAAERFGLTSTERDRTPFFKQMLIRLKNVHESDSMEMERTFLKRQIGVAKITLERVKAEEDYLRSEKEALIVRRELLEDETISSEDVKEKEERVRLASMETAKAGSELAALTDELRRKQEYWEKFEADYEWREQAVRWLENLPEERQAAGEVLDGMCGEYVRAFCSSILVYSPAEFTVRWFDGTKTDVTMDTNVVRGGEIEEYCG